MPAKTSVLLAFEPILRAFFRLGKEIGELFHGTSWTK